MRIRLPARTLWLSALPCALLLACSQDPRVVQPPQLIVRIHSTLEVRDAIDTVRVTAAVQMAEGAWNARDGVDVAIARRPWPIDIPVVPEEIDPDDERFEIVVEALEDDVVLVQSRAITRWFEDGVRILDVWLIRCGPMALGVLCEPDPTCHGDECKTCIDPAAGGCDYVEETPSADLEPLDPDAVPVDLLWPPEFPQDAGMDAAVEAGVDAAADAGMDAAVDAGSDAGSVDPCTLLDCDDENPCTVDSCVRVGGCNNDGTGVNDDCAPDDLCSQGYVCLGDKAGTCAPMVTMDCTNFDDACHVGTCDSSDGSCFALQRPDTSPCEDGDACIEGETCTSGTCGGGSAKNCNDSNDCTDDSCDSVQGCLRLNNTDACDDDDSCTGGDHCAGGLCANTGTLDCNDGDVCTDDSCDSSDVSGDPCRHVDNTGPCVDANTCTTGDQCLAGACTPGLGNACGVNATGCTMGTPNQCMCMSGFVDGGGQCVPTTNECAMGICHADADCNDPSSTLGDVMCDCKVGYTGDGEIAGTGCTDINECQGNPCGSNGGCQQGPPGTYSCNCNSGFMEVSGTCACDLNGTFATRIDAVFTWAGTSEMEGPGAGGALEYSWALWELTYDDIGHLQMAMQSCGGTQPDLCGISPIGDEAYAQWVPAGFWTGTPGAAQAQVFDLVATPGAKLVTPTFASLIGISLANSLGIWPASRAQVASGVNGAVWVDMDSDGLLGVTSYAVPPGGVTINGHPDPLHVYGATSTACPRLSADAPFPYAYYPALESLTLRRIKRFHSASRTTGYYDGTLQSCDQVAGAVRGPDAGQMKIEGRVGGCIRDNAGGDLACSNALIDFVDTSTQLSIANADFVALRVANGTTCAQVRAMSFP